MNVYEHCPEMQNDRFLLRYVTMEDCDALLKVYSDPLAVPFFNSDNCHGDDFYYRNKERMAKAIEFWFFSYREKFFVRWSIIDRQTGEAVGTAEVFRREAEDAFTDTALLRLDLRSDYEQTQEIMSVLSIIKEHCCGLFECDTITTKAIPEAAARRAALQAMGFAESANTLKTQDGKQYKHYFVYDRNA